MKTLILAGGSGTRLWPLSRSYFPKQFLKIGGKESFLQQTFQRMRQASKLEDIYIITCSDYYHEILREIPDILPENIILEPEPKNTAPAIALGLKFLREKRKCLGSDVVFVTPSDHIVAPVSKFVGYLQKGALLAKKGQIVTFGVRPHSPETGFGYILAKDDAVQKFVEKPSRKLAEQFILDGNYFWNAGYFAFSIETMEKELKTHAPEIASQFEGTYEESLKHFHKAPKISLDYAVMEKASFVAMVPLDLTWSDVGSWDNVYQLLEKDSSQNVLQGDVAAIDTKNSLVIAQKRLVATVGVSDLLIVETDDVVLIARKDEGQKVKQLVESLKERGKSEVDTHVTTRRPWGSYTVLEEGKRYKIKRICVSPQAKLSLQLHYHRSEHWIVVTGTALVTINDKETIVHEGESIFVPKSAVHRMENPGKVGLELIEVQVGEYLGEDDIVRLEDIYGRLKEDSAFKILENNIFS